MNTSTLGSVVPPRFRGQVEGIRFNEATISVIHFRGRVARLREVRQAGEQVGEQAEERLLVLCEDVTEEARMALADQGALVITQKSFGWTERSYEDIKVFIGSRVKRPRM